MHNSNDDPTLFETTPDALARLISSQLIQARGARDSLRKSRDKAHTAPVLAYFEQLLSSFLTSVMRFNILYEVNELLAAEGYEPIRVFTTVEPPDQLTNHPN